jgi:hypothetical protein
MVAVALDVVLVTTGGPGMIAVTLGAARVIAEVLGAPRMVAVALDVVLVDWISCVLGSIVHGRHLCSQKTLFGGRDAQPTAVCQMRQRPAD